MTKPEKFASVRIHWRYKDKTGVYEDAKEGKRVYWDEDYKEWSTFWWDDGNGSCDCNRGTIFGLGEFKCGETIEIENIEILEEKIDV